MQVSHGARAAVLASTAAIVLLAACGSSSTGPSRVNSAAVAAEFFDSIYTANLAAGTHADSIYAGQVLYYLEVFPAYGQARHPVTVTTGTGTETWYAFASEYVYTDGDSEFYTIAYNGDQLSDVVVYYLDFDGSDTSSDAYFYQGAFASATEDSVVTSSSSSVNSVGASCTLQSGLNGDAPIATDYANYPCTSASIGSAISLVFPAGAGLGAYETWSIGNTTFTGERFVENGASRVPGPLAALMANVRAHARAHSQAQAHFPQDGPYRALRP